MCDIQIVFSTIDDFTSAEEIARQLVEERLAACANIMPGVTSVYRWQGELQHEQEHILILKAPTDRVEALITRLKELHPYEVPEAVSLSVQSGYRPYLDWVLEQVPGTGFEARWQVIPPRYGTKYEAKWQCEGQEQFYELLLRQREPVAAPQKRDASLRARHLASFDPSRFQPTGQDGDITVRFKELVYDADQQKS